MLVAGEHLGDHDAVEATADGLHTFDLESEHGQALGQILGRPVEIHVLFEPVEGDFHGEKRLER